MEKAKVKQLTKKWMGEILAHIAIDYQTVSDRYATLKNEEYLAYEIFYAVLKRNDKIEPHHLSNQQYNFTCTKGQAWFLVQYYAPRRSVMLQSSMKHLINELNKQVI